MDEEAEGCTLDGEKSGLGIFDRQGGNWERADGQIGLGERTKWPLYEEGEEGIEEDRGILTSCEVLGVSFQAQISGVCIGMRMRDS